MDGGPDAELPGEAPPRRDSGTPPDDPCMGLDYAGDCHGTVARWCASGELRTLDCATYGMGCGWVDDSTGYYCVDVDDGGAMDAGSPRTDAGPPRTDAGPPAIDAGPPPTDAGPPRTDTGPPPGGPRPGDSVRWVDWPEQHTAADASWGGVLTDIVRHLPRSYGDTYYDSDKVTYGHETTHGINSHIRNYLNDTGRRANGFYCLEDRAALVPEPGIRKSQVASYIPGALRESRFSLYITGSTAWDDTPLYVWDEWIAYINGGEVGVDRHRAGLWREGWRDAVMGPLEFTVYGLAVGMAVEALDPGYFARETQFKEVMAFSCRRAMRVFNEGRTMESFRWDRQETYYTTFRTSTAAEPMREFVRRTFGAEFAREVFDF